MKDHNKPLPAAPESEQSVLGSMMLDKQAALEALAILDPADFYETRNRAVFTAISQLVNESQYPDMITVENHLASRMQLDDIGGAAYLSDLTRATGSLSQVEFYAQTVKNKSKARSLIKGLHDTLDQAYDPAQDINEVLKASESRVYELMVSQTHTQTYTMDQTIGDTMEHLLSIQGTPDGIIGLPSGLPYDATTGGFQRGKMYVIAGRPGMGKTAFMLQNLRNIASAGYSVGVISLEMDYIALGSRLLLAAAGVDSQRARTGKLTDHEIQQLHNAAKQFRGSGLIIDDTTELDPSLLRIKARMMKQVHGIELLAVDYVQLMKSDQESREQQVADISRTCKALSKELSIPVLALAQLSRKPDDRRGWGTRPQLSDLRESGSLEQDADAVMFLYQPAKYGLDRYPPPPEGDGHTTDQIVEVIIDKHREGPCNTWRLRFHPEQMKFGPLVSQQTPPAPHIKNENWYDQEPAF